MSVPHVEFIPAGPETDAIEIWLDGELAATASSATAARATAATLLGEIATERAARATMRPQHPTRRAVRRGPRYRERVVDATMIEE